MTHRERILAACRGEVPDRVPWIPRMDLWYNAHAAGTLPAAFQGATLREITDALGVGYHAVVPDFLNVRSADDMIDRLLGIYRLATMPFETRLREVERETVAEHGMTRVTYRTPAGAVTGVFGYTDEMRAAGVSIPWVREGLIKSPQDLTVLAHIYSHLEVVPAPAQYESWKEWVGEAGVAVAFGSAAASPMHHIMHELMGVAEFYLALHDRPREMAALAESMEEWYGAIFDSLLSTSAETVFMGGNYDETLTPPPFFEAHILPWLSRWAGQAHSAGKLLLTHTDGENRGLIDLYRRAGFDIADSVCPSPMTKMALREFAAALPDVTAWGGIPSVALCAESMGAHEFERLVDDAIDFARGRPHIVLGVADTLPPGADFERLIEITRRVNG